MIKFFSIVIMQIVLILSVFSFGLNSSIIVKAYDCSDPANDKTSKEYKDNKCGAATTITPTTLSPAISGAATAASSKAAATTGTATPASPTVVLNDFSKLSTEPDSAIGGITACSAKNTPKDADGASKYLGDCIKSIMQLVVGISTILAIMSIVALGIRSLNSFEDQTAVNKDLSERIQGFTVGAVILALFTAVIGTINPAALNISKIFSQSVVSNVQKGVKTVDFFGNSGGSTGGSGTGGGTGSTPTTATATTGTGSLTSAEIEKAKKDPAKGQALSDYLEECIAKSQYTVYCDKYESIPQADRGEIRKIYPPKKVAQQTSMSGKDISFRHDISDIEYTETASGDGIVKGTVKWPNKRPENIYFRVIKCPNNPFIGATEVAAKTKLSGTDNENCVYKDIKYSAL